MQLNETSETRYILDKDASNSHGRVVSASVFALIGHEFESHVKKVVQVHENFYHISIFASFL
jgi:hypothetical protein